MPVNSSSIVCEIREGVARITLNQPPLNILDIPMIEEIHNALERVHSAGDVKVLVINHLGKAFSAGSRSKTTRPTRWVR